MQILLQVLEQTSTSKLWCRATGQTIKVSHRPLRKARFWHWGMAMASCWCPVISMSSVENIESQLERACVRPCEVGIHCYQGAPGSPLIVSLYHFLPPRLSYTSPNVMADSQWIPAILWIHFWSTVGDLLCASLGPFWGWVNTMGRVNGRSCPAASDALSVTCTMNVNAMCVSPRISDR